MTGPPIQVLMIEDSRVAAALISRLMQEINAVSFNVTHVERLAAGLECLSAQPIDVTLLDLTYRTALDWTRSSACATTRRICPSSC